MSRVNVLLTGLLGLIGAAVITAIVFLVMFQEWLPVLISTPAYVWTLFAFLSIFSVAEIPIMIFGMRRIAVGGESKAVYMTLITNAGFTLFGAVYAVPFILLTGRLWAGVAMASLTFARLLSSIVFLPIPQKKQVKSDESE